MPLKAALKDLQKIAEKYGYDSQEYSLAVLARRDKMLQGMESHLDKILSEKNNGKMENNK